MKKLSLIIIHWNSHDHLARLLKGLKYSKEIEIIVVDNDSDSTSDGELEKLEKDRNVRVIRNRKNVGFAAACNIGATAAHGTWLLFMNPDIEIKTKDIELFVKAAEQHNFAAASYKTSDARYSKPLPGSMSLLAEFTPLSVIIPRDLFNSFTLVGGFLLIKKSVLDQIGGWDESFFMWFEDSDLTKRLTLSGHTIGLIPISMRHHGGASVRKLSKAKQHSLFFKSLKLYSQKHFSFIGKFVTDLILSLRTE